MFFSVGTVACQVPRSQYRYRTATTTPFGLTGTIMYCRTTSQRSRANYHFWGQKVLNSVMSLGTRAPGEDENAAALWEQKWQQRQ